MLRRRNGQRGLWEVLQFGDLEPEKQMDPRLRRIDEVLKDDALVDTVLEAMRGRFPQSGRRGRRGTPAEVALRMLVLKHLKNWSYEQLEWEVKGNLVYRHFCRIDAGKVAALHVPANDAVNLVQTVLCSNHDGPPPTDWISPFV